jgi:hypothetical protein
MSTVAGAVRVSDRRHMMPLLVRSTKNGRPLALPKNERLPFWQAPARSSGTHIRCCRVSQKQLSLRRSSKWGPVK